MPLHECPINQEPRPPPSNTLAAKVGSCAGCRPPSCSGTCCLCRSEGHRPRAGGGVVGRGKDPVRWEGRRFWHSSRSHNKSLHRAGMQAAAGEDSARRSNSYWRMGSFTHTKGHRLSQVLEVPVPRGRWDSGGRHWGAERGSGRSWSLAVVGGGSCSGNQGSGSLPEYELSLRAEGLPRAGPGPMPQPTPACVGSQSGDT